MSDLTLSLPGGDLDAPMAESNPSILPWQVISYRLNYGTGTNFAAAHATLISTPHEGVEVWRAFSAGPGDTRLIETDFPTAEEARAAVEEHIAAAIETHLTEEAG